MTDGTGAGTSLVADLRRPAAVSDQPAPAGALFFLDWGATAAMWYTDGTKAGTRFVTDVVPFASDGDLVRLGQWRFFRVSPSQTTRVELWRTDGSRDGTRRLADAVGTSSLTMMDGRVFFAGFGDDGRGALWASDGTPSGTRQIAPIGPSASNAISGAMVVSRGALLFVGDDGVHGPELWRSDGTGAGTAMLREIRAGERGAFDDDSGGPVPPSFTPAGDALVFRANDGTHGVELWRTDGTAEGTRRITDIDPRAADLYASHVGLTAIRGRVAFYAFEAETGLEPWITDGTSRGTRRLADVAPGPAPSRPLVADWPWGFSVAGERLYFVADDGTTGSELWSVPLAGIAPPCPGDCDREICMIKFKVIELVQRAVERCLQLHGGEGFLEDNWVGRVYRDVRVLSLGGGVSELMQDLVAGYLRL
ncbi:MAG: acyl-CoA dehydrogenase family protein [Candidatus Binatia bacterium]